MDAPGVESLPGSLGAVAGTIRARRVSIQLAPRQALAAKGFFRGRCGKRRFVRADARSAPTIRSCSLDRINTNSCQFTVNVTCVVRCKVPSEPVIVIG